MKISYNWLKQYIDLDIKPSEVEDILTNIGLEVVGIEEFQSVEGGLEGLVVGEVMTKEQHPNADRLFVSKVDVGTGELLNIICGAPNLETGQKVVVALTGTTLYKGNESMTLKETKIRGVVSQGMICAEDEVGLGDSHEGIIVLEDNVRVGGLVMEYFDVENDFVLELDLTPNRIDGASHIGVARELAAFLKQSRNITVRKPSVEDFKVDNTDNVIDVVVENNDACPRYSGLTISGITIKESPAWMQTRLKAVGLNPVSNVVDITNFILYETGQPLHAFDADKIKGGKVIVKTLPENTKFVTLDEEERSLSSEDLMICNEEEGMCIAGVFGGIGSGVTDATKNIFLESACFDPVYVRKTSKRHGLPTDAAFRFERGTDPNNTVYALKRAALLMKEYAGGSITSDVIDIYPEPVKDFTVEIRYSNVNRLIGKEIGTETIKNILKSLDIKITAEKETGLLLDIPPFRVDVRREVDVIEEILRIYGYNNVEVSDDVKSTISYLQRPDKEMISNSVSDFLTYNGFNEIMMNSLTKGSYYETFKPVDESKIVTIFNPISADLNIMRQTLLFGGMESVAHNINRKNTELKLYEFGYCYFGKHGKDNNRPLEEYSEEQHLALFISGMKNARTWDSNNEPTDFFHLKSHVENIFARLGIELSALDIKGIRSVYFDDGLRLCFGNKYLAEFGLVNKNILNEFDIGNNVYYADLYWDNIIGLLKDQNIIFKELPKYPEVKRDLALLIDNSITFEDIKKLAYKTGKDLIKKISLFDVYEGEELEAGKKSYAVGFILQDEAGTLNDKQIDGIMNNLIQVFKKELGAKLR